MSTLPHMTHDLATGEMILKVPGEEPVRMKAVYAAGAITADKIVSGTVTYGQHAAGSRVTADAQPMGMCPQDQWVLLINPRFDPAEWKGWMPPCVAAIWDRDRQAYVCARFDGDLGRIEVTHADGWVHMPAFRMNSWVR